MRNLNVLGKWKMLTIILGVVVVIGWRYAQSADPRIANPSTGVAAQEALAIGSDVYIYGYPLVTMEMTRRVMTNVVTPGETRAPMGQFVLMREYPTAAFRGGTAPNADTLYSAAWMDLSREPYILS